MKYILILISILLTTFSFSQLNFQIKEDQTLVAIPFSKVIPNDGSPILADIDGLFSIDTTKVTSLKISTFGFKDTIVIVKNITGNEIILNPLATSIEEVKIIPGENPAHRIMNQVIERRKINSPTHNDAFTYDSYSKYIFDLNEEAMASISDTTKDTTLLLIKKYFNSKYLMLLESASTRTFSPPSRDKEEITAYKVSGFTDPMLSSFANEMQSFSFYENQFEIFGKSYVNPIAFGGTKRYFFLIEDTTFVGADTVFTISFRPRKDKNFDGLKGQLYINTNGFAVEKVIVEPLDSIGGAKLKVIQEYAFIENKKWFPSKLSTEIKLPSLQIGGLKNGYIQGKGNMYIKNIVLNPENKMKRSINNTALVTSEDANYKSEKEWDSLRVFKITEKEKNTYRVLDSVSKKEHLDYKLRAITSLLQGQLPLGYVNMDITKIIDYKLFEGYRFGMGLETSYKTFKKGTIGGYAGWATKDEQWKYGGFAEFKLNNSHSIKWNLKYHYDLIERGGYSFQKEGFNLSNDENYRHIYIKNMEYQRLAETSLSGFISSNFKVTLGVNYQRIWLTDNYTFQIPSASIVSSHSPFDLAETFTEINWNIREKVMQMGDNRIGKGTKYPKLKIKYTKGIKGIYDSKYDYSRLIIDVSQDVGIKTIGKLNWLIHYGQTIGNVPLFLQQVAIGTGGNGNLSIKNTFETMLPSTYFSKQQLNLFTRFTFRAMKTNLKFTKPQLGFHHALGYGYFSNPTEHTASFSTLSKGYYEAGMILDGIFVSGFSRIGMGVFYKYGTNASPYVKENLMYKVSLSIQL